MLCSSVLTDTGSLCCHWTVSQDVGKSTQHLNVYEIILPVTFSLSPSLPRLLFVLFSFSQDLESWSLVDEILVDHLSTNDPVKCMSLAWSADGQTLFSEYTDNLIR